MSTFTLNDKVALITGASSGIGRVTAEKLALQGYHVFLACRSEEKTQPVLRAISEQSQGQARAEFIALDLGDLDSVRRCAETFLAKNLPLHLLIANAGLAGQKGLTPSGFELAFGTCHIGHFLLTRLLLERIKASQPARIVVVASKAHRHAKAIDFTALRKPTKSPAGLKEYGVAKLSNILFASELARRLQGSGVTTYSLHPGVVATDVWRSIPSPFDRLIKRFMLSEEQGAATTLYCATHAALTQQSGLYYSSCKEAEPSPLARSTALARELWEQSERWLV